MTEPHNGLSADIGDLVEYFYCAEDTLQCVLSYLEGDKGHENAKPGLIVEIKALLASKPTIPTDAQSVGMREALQKIASENTHWNWTDKDTADLALGKIAVQMRNVARAALASQPSPAAEPPRDLGLCDRVKCGACGCREVLEKEVERLTRARSAPAAAVETDAVEGDLDAIVQLIHKHVGIRQRINVDLTGVEDAAKAILATLHPGSSAANGDDLLPCPFCGGEADFYENWVDHERKWSVSCGDCNANLDVCEDTKTEAAAHWNVRLRAVPQNAQVSSRCSWCGSTEPCDSTECGHSLSRPQCSSDSASGASAPDQSRT